MDQQIDVESLVAQISTSVDPKFVYEYEKTKFVPAPDQTLLIMGQTLEDIDDYMTSFGDRQLLGGWSAYWGIPEFRGITDTYRNENGSSHNHQALVDRFPNSAIHSAMWMVGKWGVAKNTAGGNYDKVIKKYSKWAKSIDRPIYLRVGYEFDGPHNELEPEEYVAAYRHVVDEIRSHGVENIAFVWHSYLFEPYQGNALADYYPGDDYVDWVGISLFGLLDQGPDLLQYGDAILEFAREHKKPVMAAESSPTSGIDPVNLEAWNNWFVNFFSVCYEKNIKAISFINANWEAYSFPGVDWKDARLINNPTVAEAWFLETDKERYLKQSEDLFEKLGYQSD
ncbi:MAG: glycosyl hydrolase [Bacteroidota bacterium]